MGGFFRQNRADLLITIFLFVIVFLQTFFFLPIPLLAPLTAVIIYDFFDPLVTRWLPDNEFFMIALTQVFFFSLIYVSVKLVRNAKRILLFISREP